MRFDLSAYRHLSGDAWRVLRAVEKGNHSHEIVPTAVVEQLAGLRLGGTRAFLNELLKHKLVSHENKRYDGFRLTSLGLDYLALRQLCHQKAIESVGPHVGVGKEADVLECVDSNGNAVALKLHRLGRTSFKDVSRKRDYGGERQHQTWLHVSKRSAMKEYSFLRALSANGFSVPGPIACNRHAVVMEFATDYVTLESVRYCDQPEKLYMHVMNSLAALTACGLVHCDASEFNWLCQPETCSLMLIDMPQIVSINHTNAPELLRRDVRNLKAFFARRFRLDVDDIGGVDEPEDVLAAHRAQSAETDRETDNEEEVDDEAENIDARQNRIVPDTNNLEEEAEEAEEEEFATSASENEDDELQSDASNGVMNQRIAPVRLDHELRASGFHASITEQEDLEELLDKRADEEKGSDDKTDTLDEGAEQAKHYSPDLVQQARVPKSVLQQAAHAQRTLHSNQKKANAKGKRKGSHTMHRR